MTREPLQAVAWMALAVFGVVALWAVLPPPQAAHAAPPVTAGTEDHERGNLCHPNLGTAPTCIACNEAGTTTAKVRVGRYLLHVNTNLAFVSTGTTTAVTDAPFVAGSQIPVTVPGTPGLKDYSCRSNGVPLANVCFIPCQ